MTTPAYSTAPFAFLSHLLEASHAFEAEHPNGTKSYTTLLEAVEERSQWLVDHGWIAKREITQTDDGFVLELYGLQGEYWTVNYNPEWVKNSPHSLPNKPLK